MLTPPTDIEALLSTLQDEECCRLLEHFIRARNDPELSRKNVQMTTYADADALEQTFKVETGTAGYSFLIWRETGEEVAFDIQGYLAECTLPPFSNQRLQTRNAHIVTQSVTLVGPGVAVFAELEAAMLQITRFMEMGHQLGQLRPAKLPVFGGVNALQFGTRILTKIEAALWPAIEVPASIDAHGAIANAVKSGKYRFTDDNLVAYRQVERADESSGDFAKMTPIQPELFRPGDLVELQVSVRAIEIGRENKRNFVFHMSGLMLASRIGTKMLMDCTSGSPTRAHPILNSMISSHDSPGGSVPKKRKLSYTADDVAWKKGNKKSNGESGMNTAA